MSEWFKEHDWKSCDAGTYPEVQILFSAPENKRTLAIFCQSLFSFLTLHTIFMTIVYAYKTALKMRIDSEFFKLFALEFVHYVRIDV